jgi:hypothetical protein
LLEETHNGGRTVAVAVIASSELGLLLLLVRCPELLKQREGESKKESLSM